MDRVVIVGAGGIGCAVGHTLAGNGVSVVYVERDPARRADGEANGVRVEGLPARPARFVAFEEWRPAGEVVLLCTKCYDNGEILGRLSGVTGIVPVQNGFDAALESRRPTAEGIASFVSEATPGQAHTRITRAGGLHLGPRGGGAGRLAEALAARLGRGPFAVKVVTDILPFKYTKLAYNAALCPLAALGGFDNGELLRLPRLRALFLALLRENLAILKVAGVTLGKVGPLHPATVVGILDRPWLAALLSKFFWRGLRGTYCSMSRDLPAGRTEVENYNGHLIRLAGGRECPLNRAVLQLVCRAEKERPTPRMELLEPLFALMTSRKDIDT